MTRIAAQASLYPLRQQHLSPAINQALRIFEQRDLTVEPGAMSTLIAGSEIEVFDGLKEAFLWAVSQGEAVMVVTLSNTCPALGAPEGAGPRDQGRNKT
jgi:uncharacterized protein YqgV (UPF0045/DUF77 family)